MPLMSHGYDPSGDSDHHTAQVQTSPRYAYSQPLEAHESADETQSLDVRTLSPGTPITVSTRNSTYRLVLRNAESQAVTVAGGRYQDEPAEGRVAGSSINGIFLAEGRIDVGMSMELEVEGRRVVTSRVQSIALG